MDDRPKKRRKTLKKDVHHDHDHDDISSFPQLLAGREPTSSAKLRQDTFGETWARAQVKIDKVVNYVDEQGLRAVVEFVRNARQETNGKIPTGLVVAGADGNVQKRMLSRWRDSQTKIGAELLVELDANQSPNVQMALKNVIKNAISQVRGVDGYQSFLMSHKQLIPMNYDLDLLQQFMKHEGIQKVVVSILDVEVFDTGLLSELISIFSSWSEDLQFILLLGLATTVELFEARLTNATIRLLDATIFDLSTPRDLKHDVFLATQDDPQNVLYLGHATSGILVEMSTDQGTSTKMFGRAIKHAYMSHFFANALSVLLADKIVEEGLSELCEAIRNAESFRNHAEGLLGEGKKGAKEVRKLLQDDTYLLKRARESVREGHHKMYMVHEAVAAFKELPSLLRLAPPPNSSAFDIDIEALSGKDFNSSDPYTSIMSMLERVRSDQLLDILRGYSLAIGGSRPEQTPPLRDILTRLHAFQTLHDSTSIRSAYDPSHPTTTTTLTKSNTITLTKAKPQLTEAEEQYTQIMDDLLASLESYFDTHITKAHYKSLFMHEAFVYDLKVPLNGTFTPRPRFAIERALSRPGDYLGCECCSSSSSSSSPGVHPALPPTSVLWHLWRDAGAVINVRDLWEAFRSTVCQDDGDDDDEETPPVDGKVSARTGLALFYRALAELDMLGLVKQTKKRPAPGVDCIVKAGWNGL